MGIPSGWPLCPSDSFPGLLFREGAFWHVEMFTLLLRFLLHRCASQLSFLVVERRLEARPLGAGVLTLVTFLHLYLFICFSPLCGFTFHSLSEKFQK